MSYIYLLYRLKQCRKVYSKIENTSSLLLTDWVGEGEGIKDREKCEMTIGMGNWVVEGLALTEEGQM